MSYALDMRNFGAGSVNIFFESKGRISRRTRWTWMRLAASFLAARSIWTSGHRSHTRQPTDSIGASPLGQERRKASDVPGRQLQRTCCAYESDMLRLPCIADAEASKKDTIRTQCSSSLSRSLMLVCALPFLQEEGEGVCVDGRAPKAASNILAGFSPRRHVLSWAGPGLRGGGRGRGRRR